MFTTTRIDHENAQSIRTPLDTVVMLGDPARFHTSYNKVTRLTSPVNSGSYLVKSDGKTIDCSNETTFNEYCFRAGLYKQYSSYNSASARASGIVSTEASWGSRISNNKYYQEISFYLRTKQANDNVCSIIFDRIDCDVNYTITYTWDQGTWRTQTGTIPAGTFNWYGELFGDTGSQYHTRWQEGSRVIINLNAVETNKVFNCIAAGPGVMAMFTQDRLVSMDMSLKSTLAIDASSIPVSTVDIYAAVEKYSNTSNWEEGLKYLSKEAQVTVWQGYKNSKTAGGTTYAAEMINRTFYRYDESDEYKMDQNKIHIQARDTIGLLSETTMGFRMLCCDGRCIKQGGDTWVYGDAIRGPYLTIKDRYGFVMGAIYDAARLAGDGFYIDCADISDFIHETDTIPSNGAYGYGAVNGMYEWNWDDNHYATYKACGNTKTRPKYFFLGYIPDRAPRPFLGWITNLYRIANAGVLKSDSTITTKDFFPTYIDAGRPKISTAKPTPQITISEGSVGEFVEVTDDSYQYITYRDNYAYIREDKPVEDLEGIAHLYVKEQNGTYNYTLFFGDEPATRLVRHRVRKNLQTEEEATIQADEYIPAAASVKLGKYTYIKTWDSNGTYNPTEWTGEERIGIVQVCDNSITVSGNTSSESTYDWGAEILQKTDETSVNERTYTPSPGCTNGKTLALEYNGYLRLCGLGRAEFNTYSSNGASKYQFLPGIGMNFEREPVSGSFTFKGDPRLQPHDAFTFSRLDGTTKNCTIETLEIHYEKGGTTETITYREGII